MYAVYRCEHSVSGFYMSDGFLGTLGLQHCVLALLVSFSCFLVGLLERVLPWLHGVCRRRRLWQLWVALLLRIWIWRRIGRLRPLGLRRRCTGVLLIAPRTITQHLFGGLDRLAHGPLELLEGLVTGSVLPPARLVPSALDLLGQRLARPQIHHTLRVSGRRAGYNPGDGEWNALPIKNKQQWIYCVHKYTHMYLIWKTTVKPTKPFLHTYNNRIYIYVLYIDMRIAYAL